MDVTTEKTTQTQFSYKLQPFEIGRGTKHPADTNIN